MELICAAEFCGQPKFLAQHRNIDLSAVICRTTVHLKPVGHELSEVNEQLRGFPFVICNDVTIAFVNFS